MQNSPFYISKSFIPVLQGQQILQKYQNVQVFLDELKIIGMKMETTSHRIIFKSNTQNALLVKGQHINDVSITESGFFSKDYFVKMHTQFGKIKLSMKSYNQAKITIEGMLKKKQWLNVVSDVEKPKQIYTGMFDKINKQKQKIQIQNKQISQSMVSFDSLFGNLKQIKNIMSQIKSSTGQSDGDNPQINKILKDMGFMSVISKQDTGNNFYVQIAKDLYHVCANTLFKKFGGVVALLDLYYFYNKKRQLNLLSPQQTLTACNLFPSLGLGAKVVHYPNNVILIQSTTFNQNQDFQLNYKKYFQNYHQGITAQEIARRKGLPVAIVQIKLRQACKIGKLAVADRIQGIKFYKNLLLTV